MRFIENNKINTVGADDPVRPLANKEYHKKQNGITLVALVITIIILLLLAVVSINIVQNSGLIEKTKLAKETHRASEIQEQIDLFKNEQEIAKYNGGTDKTINDLIDELEEQKLITEEEKSTIMQTGKITIGEKEIIFSQEAILPKGYTKVEYLESTGTQYILISRDIVTDENTIMNIEMAFTEDYVADRNIFGCITDNCRFEMGQGWNGRELSANRGLNGREYEFNLQTLSKYQIKMDKDGVYIDEEPGKFLQSYYGSVNDWNYQNSLNKIALFTTIRDNEVKEKRISKMKVYSFSINDKLNLIPCLDTNNTPCMYDTVTGKTFYNQGTGKFKYKKIKDTIESDDTIKDVPNGYKKCEYLQSLGTTKIQTNNSFDMVNDKFEIKIENRNHFTPAFIIGNWASNKGWGTFYINGLTNYVESLRVISSAFSNTNNFKDMGRKYDTNQVFVIEYSRDGIYNNGNLISEFTEKPNKKLDYQLKHLNETKTYYFKHYRDNELINYLVPCLDTNNTPCMYDTVTGETFYNQETGEFIAGPVID